MRHRLFGAPDMEAARVPGAWVCPDHALTLNHRHQPCCDREAGGLTADGQQAVVDLWPAPTRHLPSVRGPWYYPPDRQPAPEHHAAQIVRCYSQWIAKVAVGLRKLTYLRDFADLADQRGAPPALILCPIPPPDERFPRLALREYMETAAIDLCEEFGLLPRLRVRWSLFLLS